MKRINYLKRASTITWSKFKENLITRRYRRSYITIIKKIKYKKNKQLNWLKKLMKGELD